MTPHGGSVLNEWCYTVEPWCEADFDELSQHFHHLSPVPEQIRTHDGAAPDPLPLITLWTGQSLHALSHRLQKLLKPTL